MITLVVGTGRSGTSLVSRLLHEKLQHNMLLMEDEPKREHGRCVENFEDPIFFQLDQQFLDGRISYPTWLDAARTRIKMKMEKCEHWGVKSPIFSYTLPLYLQMLPEEPNIIWAYRDVKDAAESCMKNYGWAKEQALFEMNQRLRLLERSLRGWDHLKLDFTERQDEGEILGTVKDFIF